jgi:hypothetical protein
MITGLFHFFKLKICDLQILYKNKLKFRPKADFAQNSGRRDDYTAGACLGKSHSAG